MSGFWTKKVYELPCDVVHLSSKFSQTIQGVFWPGVGDHHGDNSELFGTLLYPTVVAFFLDDGYELLGFFVSRVVYL
eukprot:7411188-Heterocapsa_arctica.AAC.1